MQYAVETFSLTKIFSDLWGRAKVYAVDDLNLQVRYNEVFGLLGPNGSGKTTTLKMLLGLLYPTKGRAVVLGGDGADTKINARIGFLPEESYLYRFLNARETLNFYGQLFGLPPKVRKMRIEALLDMVGLKAVANRPVGTYSKGMARRIGLAQALINDPDLLILDEPTTGLDPIGTRQIKDLILKLAERGKTILLCSHLLADVEDVCDRIAILYGGRIQAQGRVKDLLQQSHKRQIVTSAINDSTVEKIKEIIDAEHAECEITSPMDKLETFFIKTVAEAQRQTRPTSGAVSTTHIGEFLTERSKESILDKLVSAPTQQQKISKAPKTEMTVPAESAEPKADKQLLDELTKPHKPAQQTPSSNDRTTRTEPVEAMPDTSEQQNHTKRSILEELTEEGTPQNQQEGQTDTNEGGDRSDA